MTKIVGWSNPLPAALGCTLSKITQIPVHILPLEECFNDSNNAKFDVNTQMCGIPLKDNQRINPVIILLI